MVGIANLTPVDTITAEIGVIVEDSYQGRGVGTALVRQLAGAARLVGYRRLTGGDVGGWGQRTLHSVGVTAVEPGGAGRVVATLGLAALGALAGPGALVVRSRPLGAQPNVPEGDDTSPAAQAGRVPVRSTL